MQRSKAVTGLLAALAITALASVVGCSASEPPGGIAATSEGAIAVEKSWPGVEFGGTGPSSESITVPKGAKSIVIDFVCTGGIFTLGMGGQMEEDRSGACGGTRSYHLPLTGSRTLVVSVFLADDVSFGLTSVFSASMAEPDPAIAADCEQLSSITSSLHNARQGVALGDVTLDEWTASVEQADADLVALAETAVGIIGQQASALSAVIAEGHAHPDAFFARPQYLAASTLASQVCEDNGTPLTILDEYGG